MRPPIDGATILITGASSGIGREMARQLSGRAKALVLVARRRDRLTALRDELNQQHPALRVVVKPCDLADRAATDTMLGELTGQVGAIDVLINNAGFGDMAMFDLAKWERIESMIRLNVDALCYLTHRLVRPMVTRRRGGILNVSSGFGLQFMPAMAAYVGTKHFVTGFTEALRLDVRHCGVVVTQVCPGPVATEFDENLGNFTGRKAPSFVEVTPQACARTALRAFERGRALVVPGLVMRLLLFMGAWTPRFVLRWMYGPVAKKARQLQERNADLAPTDPENILP